MNFTFTFIKLFSFGLVLAAPLLLFLIAAIIVFGQIVGRRESWTRFDSLYWSFITATTVGYGDIRPLQKLSKTLSVIIAFLGLIMTGIIVAIALNTATIAFKQHADLEQIKTDFDNIKHQLKQENIND